MKKILLDTNIVLDVLLKREEFLYESRLVWKSCSTWICQWYIAGHTIDNLAYILHKNWYDNSKVYHTLRLIFQDFLIAPINQIVINKTFVSRPKDIEDALAVYSADHIWVDSIVTRDQTWFFPVGRTRIYTPKEFVQEHSLH